MCGLNSKWLGPKKAGGDHRRVTDQKPPHLDGLSECAWVEARKESPGWRNGARVLRVKP